MSDQNPSAAGERIEIDRAARELAYDDYLAALLAPGKYRQDLMTLAALTGELARIPLQVSDATLGEIRLQWWRDTLASGSRSGHPVADAAIAWQPRLSTPLIDLITPILDARAAELYAEPFPSAAAFDAYVAAPVRANFALRAALLSVPMPPADAVPIEAARTLGLVKACARFPYLFSKGRYPLNAGRLGASTESETVEETALRTAVSELIDDAAAAWTTLRPKLRRIGPDLRRVVLPVALAGPYLRAIQDVGHDVLRDVADPSPLERSTKLWLAARLGRF